MRSPTVKNFFSSFRVVAQKEDSIEQMFEESKVVVGGDNFGRVVYLSFCFLVLFVGFGAPQALLTVLFPANGVGFNSLAILYFCFAFASLFAQLLSRFRIDPKWSMTVASLAYVFFVGAMLTQIDWVLYMASALEGIGAAALWVSEGLWVSRSRCNERGHNVFFVLFACSSIITSLLSGLVLRYLPPMTFVAIFTGVAGVGTLMLCFVAPARLPLPTENTVNVTLKTIFLSFKVVREPRMYLLIPTMLFRSTLFAFYASVFPQMVASLDLVPWVLLTGSGGAFIGALIILFLSAKCSVRIWSLLHSVLVASGLIVAGCSLLLPPVDRLAMLIVAAFLMGSNEGIGVFLVNGFMASLHPDSPSAAFAVLRFVEPMNFGVMIIVGRFSPQFVLIVIAAFWSVVSFCSIMLLYNQVNK